MTPAAVVAVITRREKRHPEGYRTTETRCWCGEACVLGFDRELICLSIFHDPHRRPR
jgi:hypothetical protein